MTEPTLSAAEIVQKAMSDIKTYEAMAARESEVWSSVLPTREASGGRELDQQAAAKLRLNRNHTSLARWARETGRRFENGLSIGCGEGRMERSLARPGVCKRFLGVDVADKALAVARTKAAEEGLQAEYMQLDMNFAKLPRRSFDLIVAQTSLHHLLHLEHVADELAEALVPGGILWIHDYIGESQFQYTDARIAIANRLIAGLPIRFRHDRVFGRALGPVVRRAPGTLISPFESIRSAEIPGIFLARFNTVKKIETTTILNHVVPFGTRSAYAETEEGQALFETLFAIDEILLNYGILTPSTGQYVLSR